MWRRVRLQIKDFFPGFLQQPSIDLSGPRLPPSARFRDALPPPAGAFGRQRPRLSDCNDAALRGILPGLVMFIFLFFFPLSPTAAPLSAVSRRRGGFLRHSSPTFDKMWQR